MKKYNLLFTCLFLVSMALSCSSDNGESGGEGGSEGAEGSHNESGTEQGESGTRWAMNQTADEVINGIHAIISFDAATNSFVGTFENLNSNVAQQTRLEVHVFDANGNSTEFGPTPGVDMQPGAIRSISLPVTGSGYVEFTMHPEVGAPGNGG